MLDEGVYTSVSEIGDAGNISKCYVSRILRLALLAPDVVEAILNRHSAWQGHVGGSLRLVRPRSRHTSPRFARRPRPRRANRPGRTQCAMNTGVTTTFERTWRVTPPRSSSRTRLCE